MKRNGFTLVEVIVVIIILFIVGTIIGGGCSKVFFTSKCIGVVTDNTAIGSGNGGGFFASQDSREIAFSRAVQIKEEGTGIDMIFSTVDRQFAVIKVGDKIKVRISKYPPWDFDKAGTYYNGRLLRKL